MYGAGECFAYAVKRSETAKQRADQAFRALRFLQQVTQGGAESSQRLRRSFDPPTSGRDPNAGQVERDLQIQKRGITSGRFSIHAGRSLRMESGIGKGIQARMNSTDTTSSMRSITI